MRKTVLLLDGDLLARGRVEQAAAAVDAAVLTATSTSGPGPLLDAEADLVIVDLDRGRHAALEIVRAARAEGFVAPVVGFFSHVDTELGAAAEAAGVSAFRRGEFWRLLRGFLEDQRLD